MSSTYILHRDGSKHWHQDCGKQKWYIDSKRNSTDCVDLYHNGVRHRDDGPAVILANGSKMWYQNGKRHRTDGPAIEWANGNNEWYQNGKLHRTNGPAIEVADRIEWRINGIELSVVDYAAKVLDKETATLWKMSRYCWPFDFGVNK